MTWEIKAIERSEIAECVIGDFAAIDRASFQKAMLTVTEQQAVLDALFSETTNLVKVTFRLPAFEAVVFDSAETMEEFDHMRDTFEMSFDEVALITNDLPDDIETNRHCTVCALVTVWSDTTMHLSVVHSSSGEEGLIVIN